MNSDLDGTRIALLPRYPAESKTSFIMSICVQDFVSSHGTGIPLNLKLYL